MSLFGKKKVETEISACACKSGGPSGEAGKIKSDNECCGDPANGICCLKVLGSGCKNCHALLEAAKDAVRALNLDLEVDYVTDMEKIMAYGVMRMPALVVNEQVVSMGKVLKASEVKNILNNLKE